MISKYGDSEGNKRWYTYREKQKITNSFEYKKEKYSFTEEDFESYNKSRAVTLEKCIERHGELEGNKLWCDYIEKQKITKSKYYYVDKYGLVKWEELCESKAHTFENYIKWYGSEELAIEKIKERHNMWSCVSKSSQIFLNKLDIELKKHINGLDTYYSKLNQEYMIITDCRKIFYIDYFIKDWNVAIEYNGDLFHANPNKYNESDMPIPGSDLTAKEIWRKDVMKTKHINDRGIEVLVVWESDLPDIEEYVSLIIKKYKNK